MVQFEISKRYTKIMQIEYPELLLSSVPEMDPDWLDNLLKERGKALDKV